MAVENVEANPVPTQVPPPRWSRDTKYILGLLTVVLTIVGSTAGVVYSFAVSQTTVVEELRTINGQLADAKTAIAEQDIKRDKSLTDLKSDVVPRISLLEKAITLAQNEATGVKQHVDDMTRTLDRLVDITTQGVAISKSHSAAIESTQEDVKAVRKVISPKPNGE